MDPTRRQTRCQGASAEPQPSARTRQGQVAVHIRDPVLHDGSDHCHIERAISLCVRRGRRSRGCSVKAAGSASKAEVESHVSKQRCSDCSIANPLPFRTPTLPILRGDFLGLGVQACIPQTGMPRAAKHAIATFGIWPAASEARAARCCCFAAAWPCVAVRWCTLQGRERSDYPARCGVVARF